MNSIMNRRVFLKSGTLAASSKMLSLPLIAREEKIKLTFLGTGWLGTELLQLNAIATIHFETVALCDVGSIPLHKAADNIGILINTLFRDK